MAYIDHARGRFEIQTCGSPPAPWETKAGQLLRGRYQVETNWVAGCIVPEDLGYYVDGCNSISRRLLEEKYGKDIFKECMDQAKTDWFAEHPEDRPQVAAP